MKLYTYVVHHDFGLAPNPFGEFCTLTVCKPKIRKSKRLEKGDWIIGTGSKNIEEITGYKCLNNLIYAMQVSEKVLLEDYWDDSRFQYKKPIINGSLAAMYGDNIYSKSEQGEWTQLNSAHSLEKGQRNQGHLNTDISGKYALISENFYYFGDASPKIPTKFSEFIKSGIGEKVIKDENQIVDFLGWLKSNFMTGLTGDPINWKDYEQTELIL